MPEIAYRCDEHNCIVYESPCPHCGATDHDSAPVVADGGTTSATESVVAEHDAEVSA